MAGPDYTAVPHRDVWAPGIMAHTSPIYVAGGDEWRMADAATIHYMQTLVEGSLAYIREISHQHAAGTEASAALQRPHMGRLLQSGR